MIESDQSDKDNINDSLDSNEHTKKRIREDSSDDDNARSSPKKLCTSDNKITFEETKLECKSEINGSVTNIKDAMSVVVGATKDTDISNCMEDAKDITNISNSKEDVKCTDAAEETDFCKTKSENENKQIKKETEPEKSTNNEYKDSIPVESETNESNTNMKEAIVKNEDTEEDEKNSKPRKKRDKSQIEDTEVVEGLELSVECASDKESSSSSESENENEKDKKPKPKTIIIKAKPNDSELDVSTSEAEKSDLQDASEVKPKQTTKKGKRKARTSFSKLTDGDSEEKDDVSDEDYSPRTKRKLKKTQANKRKSSSSELKGSHDRSKQIDEKLVEEKEEEDEEEKEKEKKEEEEEEKEEEEEEEEEEENSDRMDDKNTEEGSKTKKIKPSDKRIEMLKKYIRTAGVRVKSYNTIWAGCKSNAAKIRCLEELLEKNGVSGRPTLEKCKKAKHRNERLKDIAELNTSNIISEGRVTRAQRKRETPTEHRQARSALKRVLRVVDSDSE